MKLTKKLLPAFGMLLLSACMMVTSTFAWFSMNDTVKATNMSISARGNQIYLQIIDKNNTTNTTALGNEIKFVAGKAQTFANAANSTDELLPVNVKTESGTSYSEYSGGKDFVWVSAIGKAPTKDYVDGEETQTDGYAPASGYTKVTATEGYYLKNTFNIRLDPTAGNLVAPGALRVDNVAFASDHSDDFSKTVCVLAVCGNYSQLYTYDGTQAKFVPHAKNDEYLSGDGTNAEGGKAFNVSDDNGVAVDIYVFFNGDSEYCTLEKLAAVKAQDGGYKSYSVDVTFTVA